MKIAICVPAWPPSAAANGVITYASHLVPELRELGHEVFVLAFWTAGATDEYTIDLRSYAGYRPLWMRALRKAVPSTYVLGVRWILAQAVADLHEKHRLDLIEIEESRGVSLGVSKFGEVPVVVRLHGPWFLTGPGGAADHVRERDEGRAIASADALTSPSHAALSATKHRYRLPPEAGSVIPNPIGIGPRWESNKCDSDRILFVGRFDLIKGGDTMLRSFYDLALDNLDLRLTFIGNDFGLTGLNGKYLRFEEFVKSEFPEWLWSRIDFKGVVDNREVAKLRLQCAVTVIASRYEVFGYNVAEAMASGCPIVATKVGGIPELIKDRDNGLLVPSENPSALADGCRTLLCDQALAYRLAAKARSDCAELYNPHSIALQTLAVYHKAKQNKLEKQGRQFDALAKKYKFGIYEDFGW